MRRRHLPLLLWPLLTLLACDDTGTRRVGESCTQMEECSDGICGQGQCLEAHVLQLPTPPALLDIAPPSPANDPQPTLTGRAFPGETIRLHADPACQTRLAETGTDAQGHFTLSPKLDADGTHHFYLQSHLHHLSSACVPASLNYTLSTQPPATPTLHEAIPASPSPHLEPYFVGHTSSGATVTISTDADCAKPLKQLRADPEGLFITQLGGPPSTDWHFYAQALSPAGNASPCALFARYTHQWDAPEPPWQSPSQRAALPEASLDPVPLRLCADPGSELHLYANPSCEGDATPATPIDDPSCMASQGFEAHALGDLWAQARDSAGQLSPCVPLHGVRPAQPADELALLLVRAQNLTLTDNLPTESAFTVGGFTRPDATLTLSIPDLYSGETDTDDTGRFELSLPALPLGDTPLLLHLQASQGGVPFAERTFPLTGPLHFQGLDGHQPLAHLPYLLHLPDGTPWRSGHLDSEGRFQSHIIAGMGLSLVRSGPELFTGHDIEVETVMDLHPMQPLTWNVSDLADIRCDSPPCDTPQPPTGPLELLIPEPPVGTETLLLTSPCGTETLSAAAISTWPHAHPFLPQPHPGLTGPTCPDPQTFPVAAFALRDARPKLLATSEHRYQASAPALPAFKDFTTDSADLLEVSIKNDTPNALFTLAAQDWSFDPRDTTQFVSVEQPELNITVERPLFTAGAELSYDTHRPFSLLRHAHVLSATRLSSQGTFLNFYFNFREPETPIELKLSALLPQHNLVRPAGASPESIHLGADPAYDRAQIVNHGSRWHLNVPCRNRAECEPCEASPCEAQYTFRLNWRQAHTPWGPIAFDNDPTPLAALLPAYVAGDASFELRDDAGLHLIRLDLPLSWYTLLRDFGHAVMAENSHNALAKIMRVHPHLVFETLLIKRP